MRISNSYLCSKSPLHIGHTILPWEHKYHNRLTYPTTVKYSVVPRVVASVVIPLLRQRQNNDQSNRNSQNQRSARCTVSNRRLYIVGSAFIALSDSLVPIELLSLLFHNVYLSFHIFCLSSRYIRELKSTQPHKPPKQLYNFS